MFYQYYILTLPCILSRKENRKTFKSDIYPFILHELAYGESGSLLTTSEMGLELGWTTKLLVGETYWTLEFSFFKVVIHLTDAGHECMQGVVGYIHLSQQSDICKWIIEELSSASETKFHYQDKIIPINYTLQLACNMLVYSLRDRLVGSIQMTLEELSVDNL